MTQHRRPDGTPETRSQADADAFHAELDDLDDAESEALDAIIATCGCTLLCYWTEERVAHIRGHIAAAKKRGQA